MATDRTPVSNPVQSFWTSESDPNDNLRTTDDLPSEADIVIIGAGFAGVVSVHHRLHPILIRANHILLGYSLPYPYIILSSCITIRSYPRCS